MAKSGLYESTQLWVLETHGMSLRDFIQQRIEEGHSVSAIARELGVDRQRLYYWRTNLGIDFRLVREVVDLHEERVVAALPVAVATGTEG